MAQGVDCPVAKDAGHSVAGGAESLWGASLAGFADDCPSPLCVLLHEHFSVASLGITMAQGIAAIQGCSSVLMVGVGVGTGVGGIGQFFLVLNRFSEADPALAQGVPV